jgi:cyanophycinase
VRGTLALVGGAEWRPPAAPLDAWLLERSGSSVVTVLPTAAKDHPEMAVATAARYFHSLGGEVRAAPVLTRADAEDSQWRDRLASARFLYIAGGDPRHLHSVLTGTPAWDGVLDALGAGATVAGSSAGAMVLCDRMLIPWSKSTQPGLGLLHDLVIVPHFERWRARLLRVGYAVGDGRVLGIDEATGLVLEADGCLVLGAGTVSLYRVKEGGPPSEIWTTKAPDEPEHCL